MNMSAAQDLSHLKPQSPHGTVMALSMMKDEAPYLLEWFAHHLAVGFTDILVYTNDCTDGTVEMLQRLEVLGLGRHRHNVIPEGIKPQPSALAHAEAEPLVAAADWLMVFDADEFLCINHPSGTLDGMISDAVARDANGIVITWRIFGSGFVTDWSRAPVTEQYLYAAPPLWRMGWGVKTLFKYDPEYWRLGIHRPKIRNKHMEDGFPDTIRWLNGSGQPMEDYFRFRGWRSIRRTLGYDWAQLNHYAVKSVEAYAIRKFRGNVNNKKDKYNADYWSLQDRNEVRDESVLRHAVRRNEIMAALLGDPVLSSLHHAALERIETRLAEYRQTEAYTELRAGLLTASEVPITEVTAKPPRARDPLRIAAMMSDVERRSRARLVGERRVSPSAEFGDQDGPYLPGPAGAAPEVALEWVDNRGVRLPADPRIFTPAALGAIRAGKFGRGEGRAIASQVAGCARLLDVTGGFGHIAMAALVARPGLSAMAACPRRDLAEFGARVAEENDLTARLRFARGPLILAGDDGAGGARGLAACLADFRPDVLRLDARSLAAEMAAPLRPGGLRRILVQFGSDEAVLAPWAGLLATWGFTQGSEIQPGRTAVYEATSRSASA